MKKINYLLLFVICLFSLTISVNAKEPKVINGTFANNFIGEYTVDDSFDFSKVSFASSTTGTTITGDSSLKKILSYYTRDCMDGETGCEGTTIDYFTAYCLDGNKKYPLYETIYNDETISDTDLFKNMVVYEFFEECTASTSCTLLDDIDGYEVVIKDNITTPDETTLTDFANGDTVTATLSNISIQYKDTSKGVSGFKVISAAQMAAALGTTFSDSTPRYDESLYSFKFKMSDFSVNKYSVTDLPTTIGYNRALWIIEHSYPNLSLEISLEKAGTSLASVREDVSRLEATTLNAIEDTTLKEAKLTELVQNYVYSVTQYAIWKSVGDYYKMASGTKYYLGDTLTDTTVNGVSVSLPQSLNILYKYYIMDRDEYTNYANTSTAQNYSVVNPESGKELYSETSDAYIYGPYTITGNMIYTPSINLSVASPTSGVTIIDKAGNTITSIKDGGQLYLKVSKSAKPTKIELNLASTQTLVYTTTTSRGSLFNSESKLDQTVATGAEMVKVDVNAKIEILINPKTGVEDFGTILLVALIAFALGYVVLRFKQSPMEQL